MKILIVSPTVIPVALYGGIGRVIWSLGKELALLGHEITYLVPAGSSCDFAKVLPLDTEKKISEQIPDAIDLVHFNGFFHGFKEINKPYVITIHGNMSASERLDKNAIFVSKNHAERYGSDSFVHNGLDWEEYTRPNWNVKRECFHFLGKAAWRLKNVQGAIDCVRKIPKEKLNVMGGVRFNIKMGLRFTFSPRILFSGFVGGEEKDRLLNSSKGLVFPVRWHEPFGLAITESLFYGCPVFGTPYGSLTELVPKEVGFLSNKRSELSEAMKHYDSYDKKRCHEYARDVFNSKQMALSYLKKYEEVLSNRPLNAECPQLITTANTKFLDWEK